MEFISAANQVEIQTIAESPQQHRGYWAQYLMLADSNERKFFERVKIIRPVDVICLRGSCKCFVLRQCPTESCQERRAFLRRDAIYLVANWCFENCLA